MTGCVFCDRAALRAGAEVYRAAKAAWDARLAPDGYFLSWTSFPSADIKDADNRRPDPLAAGSGRARLFGLANS